MNSQFENYISDNNLFTKEDKLLVAISGGVDSMALLCLLWTQGYNFGVAHCNFQLRGEESNQDEQFVERFASFVTDKFHKKRFDTEGYGLKN
jgi:tRNA(Ile)-lysidine synthase